MTPEKKPRHFKDRQCGVCGAWFTPTASRGNCPLHVGIKVTDKHRAAQGKPVKTGTDNLFYKMELEKFRGKLRQYFELRDELLDFAHNGMVIKKKIDHSKDPAPYTPKPTIVAKGAIDQMIKSLEKAKEEM
jgi:hypothetical protein